MTVFLYALFPQKVLKLQQSNKMQESTQTIQAHASSMQNSENKHLQEVVQLQQKLHKQVSLFRSKAVMQPLNLSVLRLLCFLGNQVGI